jgi:hypothetical protein
VEQMQGWDFRSFLCLLQKLYGAGMEQLTKDSKLI